MTTLERQCRSLAATYNRLNAQAVAAANAFTELQENKDYSDSYKRDRLSELWGQVEQFVAKRANRIMTMYATGYMTNNGGVEFDDLYNSGYLALVAAVDTYKPEKGMKFISWFAFFVKTAFGNASGWRSQKNDALRRAVSLDAPIDGEDDSDPISQIVEDTGAAQEIQAVEDKIFQEQLHAALERALQQLTTEEVEAIKGKYFEGRELSREEGRAERRGLSRLRAHARLSGLQHYIELRTPYYLRVGVQSFQNSGDCSVERIVFLREQLLATRGVLAPP